MPNIFSMRRRRPTPTDEDRKEIELILALLRNKGYQLVPGGTTNDNMYIIPHPEGENLTPITEILRKYDFCDCATAYGGIISYSENYEFVIMTLPDFNDA